MSVQLVWNLQFAFEGVIGQNFNVNDISCPSIFIFISANSADLDEMLPYEDFV